MIWWFSCMVALGAELGGVGGGSTSPTKQPVTGEKLAAWVRAGGQVGYVDWVDGEGFVAFCEQPARGRLLAFRFEQWPDFRHDRRPRIDQPFGLAWDCWGDSPTQGPRVPRGLDKLPNLTLLDLFGVGAVDADLRHLSGLRRLRVLDLGLNENLTDAGLPHLAALEDIRMLSLAKSKVTDEGLKHLAGLKRLEKLNLRHTGVRGVGLNRLAALENLHYLILADLYLSDAGVSALAGLKSLRSLSLRGSTVSDQHLKTLMALEKLHTLDIAATQVSAEGLSRLVRFKRLRHLDVAELPVDDTQLSRLTALTELRSLGLAGTKITEGGLAPLARLARLEALDLRALEVTAKGVRRVAAQRSLRTLVLFPDTITDDMLGELKEAGRLHILAQAARRDGSRPTGAADVHSLDLSNTSVTDAGLRHLAVFGRLRLLKLAKTPVTPDGVARLRKAMPRLSVDLEPD